MNPFSYERVNDVQQALAEIVSLPSASFVAGGTELLNWMKEGIIQSPHLVDINRLPLATIDFDGSILTIGALARMSEVASIDLSKVPQGKVGYGSQVVLYDGEREEEWLPRLHDSRFCPD